MNKKSLIAVGIALAVVASVAGPAMAAAPSVDSESTDTTTTTELDGTSTQTYNDSTNSTLSYSADSNSSGVDVRQGDRVLASYEQNSSDQLEFVTEATGTYYVNATFADDASDYPGIEADAGQTVDITAEIINDTSLGADADTTNVTFSFANDANTSFVNMNDSETMTADSTGSEYRGVLTWGNNDSDAGAAEVEQDDIGVNGEDQDEVVVHIANADAQDSAAAVFDASEDSDVFSTIAVANFGGETIPVLAAGQDMPDWMDDDMTYATVSEDGTTVTVVNAGESLSEDDEEADFSMTANDAIGYGAASSLASDYGAGFGQSVSLGLSAFDVNGTPELEEV